MPTLDCTTCDYRTVPGGGEHVCPVDGGILDMRYRYEHILRLLSKESLSRNTDRSMWRYRSLLPMRNGESQVPLPNIQVGYTPLYHLKALGEKLGLSRLFAKDETRNPTGSLKDRASALAVVRAQEEGKSVIATASTGNAASSLAGMAAASGLQSVIFVPRLTPPNKLAQIVAYGSSVFLVEGTYDQAYDLCETACGKYGWYNRNTARNPYLAEGKKTVSFEICEQMGWDAPDTVYVPSGDGCVLAGVWKGFCDFHAMGLIAKKPRMIGVQPTGSNALAQAFGRGAARASPVEAHTIADSLSVSLPKDDVKALKAVRDSGGEFLEVSDQEMLDAQILLGQTTGVFAEPAASASLAGLVRHVREKRISVDERVILLVTGSGLKNTEALRSAIASLPVIAPDQSAFEQCLRSSSSLIKLIESGK